MIILKCSCFYDHKFISIFYGNNCISILKTKKIIETVGIPVLRILSSTRSLKLKLFGRNQQLRAMGQRDIATSRMNWPQAYSVKNGQGYLGYNSV